MTGTAPLGIVAGGGDLPIAVASSAQRSGRGVFVVALFACADQGVSRFDHEWVRLGEVGRILDVLRAHGCREILLAGRVARPRFADLKLDAKGLLLLPQVMAAARRGDDALLRTLIASFEAEGFRALGVGEAAPELLAGEGVFGRVAPSAESREDIARAVKVVRQLGMLDVGQAAAVCDGLVLAVEAAEGTDAMIARIGALPEALRGTLSKPRGVLVKALKPDQDGKTDLPVIGVTTVHGAAGAGLAGIAVEAGRSIVIDKPAVIEAADRKGIFVLGFSPAAYSD